MNTDFLCFVLLFLTISCNQTCYPILIQTTWWCHEMETFSALLALCAGNSPVTGEFPHKGQWRGALMFSLMHWRHCNERYVCWWIMIISPKLCLYCTHDVNGDWNTTLGTCTPRTEFDTGSTDRTVHHYLCLKLIRWNGSIFRKRNVSVLISLRVVCFSRSFKMLGKHIIH